MVYVYAKQSQLNKYIGAELSVDEIESTLKDLGMDIKGIGDGSDPELKVEITAEKIDMISIVGIARAIRFYRGLQTELTKYKVIKGKNKLFVETSVDDVRPKTVAAILRDVPMTQEFLDEMIEIQEKIHVSFGRNRKKVAIGIYPLNEIKFPIFYKALKPGDIKFQPLEGDYDMNGYEIIQDHHIGKKYAHLLEGYDKFPVFEDDKGDILSMPPIINSQKTGRVTPQHKDLFIECSAHNLTHLDNVLKVLVTTFIEMGAKAESVKVEYSTGEVYELNLDNIADDFSLKYANKLIGINVDKKQVVKLLNKVQYGVKKVDGDKVFVEIPAYRSDIWHDADIADDLARAYGYNNIELTFPNISTIGETLNYSDFKERISQSMVQFGFLELYTYMLSSSQIQFNKMNLDSSDFKYVKLIDSEDQGLNMIRIMALPENLEALHVNRKNKYPQKIFENAWTIQKDNICDTGAKNEAHLVVNIADPKSNYTQIKEVLDGVFRLNEIEFELVESSRTFLIEGRGADVKVCGEIVGFIGELHPKVLINFGLIVPVSSFEINLERIYGLLFNKK